MYKRVEHLYGWERKKKEKKRKVETKIIYLKGEKERDKKR